MTLIKDPDILLGLSSLKVFQEVLDLLVELKGDYIKLTASTFRIWKVPVLILSQGGQVLDIRQDFPAYATECGQFQK